MFVHFATICAMSSSSISSFKRVFLFVSLVSRFWSCFSSSGNFPNFSSAAFCKSASRSAFSISIFTFSISPFMPTSPLRVFFSVSHWLFKVWAFLVMSSRIFVNFKILSSFWLSDFKDCNSIWSCNFWRSKMSNSIGIESISILIELAASSTRSIALSGKNLSVIYLSDNFAAATRAESKMRTPWCTSYLSLSPLKIEIVSSTVGSSTFTGWKRRSSAGSFSIYFLYSFTVVAPIVFISPRASIGFKRFDASVEPSCPPAPTTVCNSSINKIIEPSDFSTSFITFFKRSSNSPRNLAPAINAPISSATSFVSLRLSGTSPRIILCASPSTMAVLPTPASPIRTGLFFVFRFNTWIILLTSSSRPITGSSLPDLARSVKSIENFSIIL